ncbi:MAG: MraY family glycosyltransferase [Deferrisomatales bacterium]|nr:MraY family glycosyltransferase [Deferrisomatales bacterium]
MLYLTTFLFALFVTMALTPLLRTAALRLGVVDVPAPRKVHQLPMPRAGGVALVPGVLFPVALWAPPGPPLQGLLLGAGVMALFGLADDVYELGYKAKFAGQFLAAGVVVLYGGVQIRSLGMLLPDGLFLPGWLAIPLTLVVIVGATNAVNFSDGLDGLAGGICFLAFSCIGYLAYRGENGFVAVAAAAAVGGIFGFLRFNTYPALLFMGDTGSQFLGFLVITLALVLTQGNTPLSPALPLLIAGLPVLDTLAVMGTRIAKGGSPFVADRNHFHHRLIRVGFFHADAVRIIYVAQAALVTAAYLLRFHSDWLILCVYLGFAFLALLFFFVIERSGWRFQEYAGWLMALKVRVRRLRERGILVKAAFRGVWAGLPTLFVFSCVLPSSIPRSFGLFAAAVLVLVLTAWFLRDAWRANAVRLAVYLMAPFAVYLGDTGAGGWAGQELMALHNAAFGVLVVLILLVVKFSRRQTFQSTPLDMLILFLALVVPNLLDGPQRMGLVAAKMIVLFFGYEVLMSESRGELKWVGSSTVMALAITVLRGALGQ